MEDCLPQDEYFEWEDIVAYRKPEVVSKMEHQLSISEFSSLSRPSSPGDELDTNDDGYHWNDPEIDLRMGLVPAARSINPAMSLPTSCEAKKKDSSINIPPFDAGPGITSSSSASHPHAKLEGNTRPIKDDSELYIPPSTHVDYFSHVWCVEDIFSSWRHLQSREKSSKNAARLENVTWRVWAKLSSDLPTVPPQEINWQKDIDDICLYGPYQVSAHKERSMTCSTQTTISKVATKKACLKKPKISDLLLQGSQISWTGARTTTIASSTETNSEKRAVKFNEIVEQCISVEISRPSSPDLPRSKSFLSRNTTSPISPTRLQAQQEDPCDTKEAGVTTFSLPPTNKILAPSDSLAEWTWLGAEEEDELDWISQLPGCSSSTYSTAIQQRAKDVIHDPSTKFERTPRPTPAPHTFRNSPPTEDHGYVPLSDSESSMLEDEDDLVAQYLFDNEHLERSDSFSSISSSDMSSGSEDGVDEEVEVYVSGRVGNGEEGVVDEKRMERMQEIACMDEVKRNFYDEVMEEFNAGWE